MVKRLSLALLVMPLWPPSKAMGEIVILVPGPFAAIYADHISVVGKTPASRVFISTAAQWEDTLSVSFDVFHARVALSFGFNEIYVHTDAGDSVWLAVVRLPLSAQLTPSRVRYPRYVFHEGATGKVCAGCHELAPFTTQGEPLPDSICNSCHPPDREWINPHRPAAEGECRVCHGADAVPAASPAAQRRLCQACHAGKIEQFDKTYQHGPVASGSCVACHNPHGSRFAYGLRLPMQTLCVSCHEDVDRQAEDKTLHPPFAVGNCTACHNPHATNYEWNLEKRSDEICLTCHGRVDISGWHGHPTSGKPRSKNQEDVALNARGHLECISCHDPHCSEAEYLLRSTEHDTCRGCHATK